MADSVAGELQEDLTNLQLLYGLLWSQVTVRLPTVTTMLNSIGEKLKKTRALLSQLPGSQEDEVGSAPFSSISSMQICVDR